MDTNSTYMCTFIQNNTFIQKNPINRKFQNKKEQRIST